MLRFGRDRKKLEIKPSRTWLEVIKVWMSNTGEIFLKTRDRRGSETDTNLKHITTSKKRKRDA